MAGTNSLEELNSFALSGSSRALDELSKIALGGSPEARVMIQEIDEKKIVFINDEKRPNIPKRSNLMQTIFHPIESIYTKIRQIEVSVDMAHSPVGSTQEEFPNLGISEASRLLRRDKKN